MKQRILAILLSLTMMFTLVPTAMAEGEEVAQIGNTKYETLAAAFDAAKDGDTITLLKSGNGNGVSVPANKFTNAGVTVNFNGYTYMVGGQLVGSAGTGTNAFQLLKDNKITFKNGSIVGATEGSKPADDTPNWHGAPAIVIQNYCDLTLDNMTVTGGDETVYTMSNNCGNVVIKDTTINAKNGDVAFDVCRYASYPSVNVTVKGNSTINGTVEVSGVIGEGQSRQLNIEGGSFAGDFRIVDDVPANISITGGTFNTDVSAYVADGYTYNSETKTVEPLGETNAVAKVGDTYYKTLADAVTAAENDETVTLLKNAETTVELSFTNKAITLDLNGKTVSGTFTDNFSVIEAGENASLTVQDTSVAGTGKIASNKYGISARDGGALIVKRGTIESEYAPLSGNNTAGDMNFTVNGGTLTAKHGPAIYMPGQVNLSITDGVLNGGISLRMGQVSISGGTINAATDGLDSPAEYYHYSGNAWLPDALYVFGGTYTSKNTTYGNSLHLNITGGTFNCANGQGSAVAIYDLGKVEQVMEITISDEAKLGTNSTARNAYDKLSLSDIGVTSPKPGFGAHSGQVSTTITGGLFSSNPSAYVPDTHHVEDSGNGSYPFAVKEGAKSDATIIVTAATNAAVSDTIESGDKAKIEAVKDKANVEGMAAAIRDDKKAAIAKAADVTDEQLAGKNMIETEITVKVEAKAADLANGKLTFEASPVATVKVNGAAKGTTVPVTNDMLNGQPITVKLPLPEGFTPKQIKHISSDGSVEYFLKTAKRGAKLFTVDSDNCAVFTITKFSTFELSGTVTYVEPSYYSGSSSDPTYSVTVDKTENGSVTVSPKNASKGDTVTVTVKPDSGYVLETLTVTDKNGNELTLKDKGDGKYTFTMPAGKVEVKATFMEDNSMLNFFYDVPNGAYFYEAVKWAVKNGITTGVGNDLFAPEQPCTRAQIVTFLWRAAGSPEPKAMSSFTDVPANAYYAKAVAWAVENGITNGMTETTFAPNATCTRGQSVTFLYRALKGTAGTISSFADVPANAFYADAVGWALSQKVTDGTSNTTFSPDDNCTRGQIVTFLYRAYQGK
jgi:uncharacterized Zn-binding protein involved in type VI secretion